MSLTARGGLFSSQSSHGPSSVIEAATSAITFVRAFKFNVIVPGFKHSAFHSLSEIQIERPEPKTCEATLSRGRVEGDHDMENWVRASWAASQPRTLSVHIFNRPGDVLQRVTIRDARPITYLLGPWDASKDEVLIESLVFSYDASRTFVETVSVPKT